MRSHLTGRSVQQLHLSQGFATSIAASKRCRALKSNDAEIQRLRAPGVGKLAKYRPRRQTPGWFVRPNVHTSMCSCCPAFTGLIPGTDHVGSTFIWDRSHLQMTDDPSCLLPIRLRHWAAPHHPWVGHPSIRSYQPMCFFILRNEITIQK